MLVALNLLDVALRVASQLVANVALAEIGGFTHAAEVNPRGLMSGGIRADTIRPRVVGGSPEMLVTSMIVGGCGQVVDDALNQQGPVRIALREQWKFDVHPLHDLYIAT
jgi:hypothetical protein